MTGESGGSGRGSSVPGEKLEEANTIPLPVDATSPIAGSSSLPAASLPTPSLDALERIVVAEEMASLLRHELRNNLSSIRNAAFYLKRRVQTTHLWGADARVQQFFTLIEDMVVASTRVLDDRLKLRHAFSRAVSRVSGRACVERAVTSARVAPNVRIEVEAGPGEVEVDPAEVAVAIRCLVENAAEAMPAGGRVRITAEKVSGQFIVTVSDEGEGIVDANRELIFEAFHTTKDGHVGLGLNVARRIARRYGGDVTERPNGGGASMALSLSSRTGSVERR